MLMVGLIINRVYANKTMFNEEFEKWKLVIQILAYLKC